MPISFVNRFRGIFQVKDTPHRIAAAFSIGVFLGISPLFGIHTIVAFFLAWCLGLNRLVAIAGVCITNPWTIVPIYSLCLWSGAKLTGMKEIMPDINWNEVSLSYMLNKLTPLIVPFLVGTLLVGMLAAIFSYFIVNAVIRKYRKISDGT